MLSDFMFTGIVASQIRIQEKRDDGNLMIALTLPQGVSLKIGASVLLSGICSTVVKLSNKDFTVVYMPETRKKTTVDSWQVGDRVHFEESLRVGESVDGHFVFGHIDTMAIVSRVVSEKSSYDLYFSLKKRWMSFIVPKGSIAIDGVSLTVVSVDQRSFSVSLIPYTIKETHLGILKKGDSVNIEIDMLAKYAGKAVKWEE